MATAAAMANRAWLMGTRSEYRRFTKALHNPAASQNEILQRYLRDNAATEFGRRHRFVTIRTMADYQHSVPISTYDDYLPYIEKIAVGTPSVLTAEPILAFVLSSGSASAEKRIPYTRSLQREFNRGIASWVGNLFRTSPTVMGGLAYWSISPLPARTQHTGKIPIGFDDDSEYVGGLFKNLLNATLAVPAELRHVGDIETFRYLTLLCLLRTRDLRLISIWHPSFLRLLIDTATLHWDRLIADICDGTIPRNLPANVTATLKRRIHPDPVRAAELRSIDPSRCSAWWPQLSVISCWSDAHAREPSRQLADLFPQALLQGKGLLSTETFVSLPWSAAAGTSTPLAIRSHLFELLPEDGGPAIPCDQADLGGIYTVVVSTAGGFYRYQTHDRVRITARCGNTPCVEFLGKTDHISDLFGEKLNAAFVGSVLAQLETEFSLQAPFAMLAPDGLGYTLFLETPSPLPPTLPDMLEQLLRQNPHYDYCRTLSQLAPAQVCITPPNSTALYLEICRGLGQRLGIIKPTPLHTAKHWRSVFTTSSGDHSSAFSDLLLARAP